MKHSAKQLRFWASLLAADGSTVITEQVGCDVQDLTGRRLEQAQLIAAETSHMILMRGPDAEALPAQGYVSVDDGTGATLYVVDWLIDPRNPRPGVWTEVYCHVERSSS